MKLNFQEPRLTAPHNPVIVYTIGGQGSELKIQSQIDPAIGGISGLCSPLLESIDM
jgi:hypothetical protein